MSAADGREVGESVGIAHEAAEYFGDGAGRIPGVPLIPPDGSNIEHHDLVAIAHGDVQSPRPTLHGLLYPDAVNGIHGEPGIGKSWVATEFVREALRNKIDVLILDFEDAPVTAVTRLGALGWRFTDGGPLYYRPVGTLSGEDVAWLERLISDRAVGLVVIDSVAEAMAANGLDENSATDVTKWFRLVARPLARAGPAVLAIDHVTKATGDQRGRWARGSGAKLAAIDGAAYTLEAAEGFSRNRSGVATVRVSKDRHGAVGGAGEAVRTVKFEVAGGSLHAVHISPISPIDVVEPPAVVEDVVDTLKLAGGVWASKKVAAKDLGISPDTVGRRLEQAVNLGLIVEETQPGGRTSYRLPPNLSPTKILEPAHLRLVEVFPGLEEVPE